MTIERAVNSRRRVHTLCLHGGVYRTGDVYLHPNSTVQVTNNAPAKIATAGPRS